MVADLTGGLDPGRERVFAEAPPEAGMRDAVNMWVWDDAEQVGFPRFAVEAVAPDWSSHEIHLSIGLADGSLFRNWEPGGAHPVDGTYGSGTHFGAGSLEFDCIEPFRRFRTSYDGSGLATEFDPLLARAPGERRAQIHFEIDLEGAAPPWVNGTMSEEAARILTPPHIEAAFMGGARLEQLCRAHGRITVDGVERSFSGGGLRIRRQGIRQIDGFWGHCWQSALFPSGRGFGYCAYPDRPDGSASYNEGYIFEGDGKLVPARVVKAPWLSRLQHFGEDVSCVLETSQGTIEIEATTVMSMPTIAQTGLNFPPLLQSIVRFRWNGEEGHGMTERSNLPQKISNLS